MVWTSLFYFFNQLYDGSVRLLSVRVWRRFIDYAVPAHRDQILQSYKSGIKYIYWQIRKHTFLVNPKMIPEIYKWINALEQLQLLEKDQNRRFCIVSWKGQVVRVFVLEGRASWMKRKITRYENLPFCSTQFNRSMTFNTWFLYLQQERDPQHCVILISTEQNKAFLVHIRWRNITHLTVTMSQKRK